MYMQVQYKQCFDREEKKNYYATQANTSQIQNKRKPDMKPTK